MLRSWALPKGVPADPKQDRLAVAVDDHELDHLRYEDAEKSIADIGWWEDEDRTERRMLFVLHGRESSVRYALIDTGPGLAAAPDEGPARRLTSGGSSTRHPQRRPRAKGRMDAHTDGPDVDRLPVRREPQPADARGWSAAVPQAGGRGAQLLQGHVRGDADPRPAGAAVPQAADPVGVHGRPVVLDRGRPVRHRVPRAAQRPAQARARPRAARAVRASAQHAARARAAAVGDPPHRGPARRSRRDVLQDAPRPDRRGLLDASDAERPLDRSGPSRHGADLVRRALPEPLEEQPDGQLVVRVSPSARFARRWRSAPTRPGCPRRW